MDADKALKNMRDGIARVRRCEEKEEGGGNASFSDAASELADAAEALDEWLSKGGYLPKPWSEAGKVGNDV